MSSNVSQSYPYSSESDEERAAAVDGALARDEDLRERITAESMPLGENPPGENGAPVKWWTWVCPACTDGRLHVAGYARDKYGLYTVCDGCSGTFLR